MEDLFITIVIVLLGSAMFSGTEAALFSVPLARARVMAEQKRRNARTLVAIKENIHRPITVIVVLNNIFNIAGSIIVGIIAARAFDAAFIGAISAVFVFLVIIVGEIIPKSVGESYAEPIALIAAKPLRLATEIFWPVVWFIETITSPITKKKKGAIVSEEEIRTLSNLGHLEGSIEKDEKEMIQKVFKLNDLASRDIMTPRTMIVALQKNKTLRELEEEIYALSHSRLPIFGKDFDDIVGMCHQRDLLTAVARDQKDRKVIEFKRDVTFVSESTKADELLPLFQKERRHLAIVKDEFGGTAGIVTLEDVLEQLVGEIMDETDREMDKRAEAKKRAHSGG